MKIAVLYVGSSLLAPLRRAEREIEERHSLGLRIAAHNCTLPIGDAEWPAVERDLAEAEIVLLIHVTDADNGARIGAALDRDRSRRQAVIVFNCMGDLMRRLRMGGMDLATIWKARETAAAVDPAIAAMRKAISWMSSYARRRRSPERYIKLLNQVPALLRFIPPIGKLQQVKHYLTLFCYLMQPTPANIHSMLLYAVKHCAPEGGKRIRIAPPETPPAMGIYHPDAAAIFATFEEYRRWYERARLPLDPARTIGLLLLRPQVVSGARQHYDALIRALEAEPLAVVPVLSTFMDNRDACGTYLVDPADGSSRVSQVLSLTGFSFVGGPAMNDSQAAVEFLKRLNKPLRSAVSLDMQTIDHWNGTKIGLNPVQTVMQVAIPEIDGATEPFVFGGLRAGRDHPEPLEDRCRRIARRAARWSRVGCAQRSSLRLAFLIYCFPPDKGNLGTAAGLDVFPSLWNILRRLETEGYEVAAPQNPDALRETLLAGDGLASIAYRLPADEYFRLCPYVGEIETEWGPAPGAINTQGSEILIHGIEFGNVFVGVQPTFGYEGDPMRMLMAEGATPHHGFMGLYTYLEEIFRADALVHVGTHGALEFMPGKQAGLSSRCWPDRLIGSFPNLYIYSVNNPSEGTIAKRRSYAELISYLTPPIENSGLYRELATLKDLLTAYRQSSDERQREQIFMSIEETACSLHLDGGAVPL